MRGGCMISARFLSRMEAGEIDCSLFGGRCFRCLDPSTIPYVIMILRNAAYIVFAALIVNGEALNENTTATYKPEDLLARIFNLNITIQSREKNGFRFEDDNDIGDSVIFKPNEETKVQNYIQNNDEQRLKFSSVGGTTSGRIQKKTRKQRVHRPQGFGLEYQGPYSPASLRPGGAAPPYHGPWHPGPAHRPLRRPRPSLASEALSSVTEALTSIALYDDKQCVARLLCEAAGGGALGTSDTLQSMAGLQPLLTLLSAYSGVSSNPLFVFGRAAFLGMSSKNNPASCRYAYPLCPSDPEQLVYYLNNHNGGFFRFFNAPQRGQQSLNQFYGQLSQNNDINQQNIGQYNDVIYHPNQIQDYNSQHYGAAYPYQQNKYGLLNNIRFKNSDDLNETNKIEKRIQNRPEKYLDFDDDLNFDDASNHNTRWAFPESEDYIKNNNIRTGKGLKFPENVYTDYTKINENKRDPRGFVFPGSQSKIYLNNNHHQERDPDANINYNYNNYINLNSDFYKGYNDNYNRYNKDQSIQTVYVVRGNGDPNHPEIIKLEPGQTVH